MSQLSVLFEVKKKMSKVFITDYIDNPILEKEVLGGEVTTEFNDEAEVLLVWHQKIDKKFLDNFPKLVGVVRYGVGFDNIDLEEIKRRGLVFCNTPDYGTDEVSDTALGMILNLTRGVMSYDSFSRNYFDSWQENTITNIRRSCSLKLGVIGAGRIGTALIRKAREISFDISFYDPYKDSGYEKAIGVRRHSSLKNLLNDSDVISIHTPLTNETQEMVNSDFFAEMKKGSFLINTARGEIVASLDNVYDALLDGTLEGVGLDVLPEEPPKESKLIDAWRVRDTKISHKILINPHTSYYSQESYKEMRIKAASNAKRIIDGLNPINIIASGR